VRRVAVRVARALRREQARSAHQPQDTVAPDAMPEGTETDPHLAMAFAKKRTIGQHFSDRVGPDRVGHRRLQSSLRPGRRPGVRLAGCAYTVARATR
jgi:hypothetical protein